MQKAFPNRAFEGRVRVAMLATVWGLALIGILAGMLGDTINDLAKQLDRIETFRREFIANVSHELKTPLTVMWLQLGSLLQEPQLSPEQRESLYMLLDRLQSRADQIFAEKRLWRPGSKQV